MKTRFILMIVLVSFWHCEHEFKNPLDMQVTLPVPGQIQCSQSGEHIQITWPRNDQYKTGYLVERKSGDAIFTVIAAIEDKDQLTYLDTTSQTDVLYQYRICGRADENKSPYSDELNFKADFPAPSNVNVRPISATSARITWQDNCTFEEGFRVGRKRQDQANWVIVGETGADETTYTDEGLTINYNYQYRIQAFTRRNVSAYSPVSGTSITLVAPSNLSSTAMDDHRMRLNWKDNSDIESGFIIERRDNLDPTWQIAGSVEANVTSFTDDSLRLGILYTYRVKAFTGSHESAYSNEASRETFFPAPVNLQISASTEYSVTFVWQDQCNFEQGYVVKYIRQDGLDTTTVLLEASSTTYTLDDISKEYVYYFKVYAYTPFNESASLAAYTGYRKEFVPEAQLTGLNSMIRSLDFSTNSALLAAGDDNGQVRVWDTGTWSQRQSLSADTAAVPDMVTALNFAGANPWLAMGDLGGTVRVVNSTSWSEVAYLFLNAYSLYDVKFSPNDQYLAAAQYKFIYVWATDGWSLSKNLTGHNDAIHSVAFSKNGTWLASAGKDQGVRIWSTQSWSTIQTLSGHTGAVNVVRFSPNSQWLASAGDDKHIKIWSTSDWVNFDDLKGHQYPVLALDFSGDGQWLASSDDGSKRVRIWSAGSWEQIDQVDASGSGTLASLRIATDGRWLAAGDTEGRVIVWQLRGIWRILSGG